MLGELSGSLAHELNQPLTAILSNAEAAQLIAQGDTPPLSLDDVTAAIDMIGADALAVHLNFLQESVQPEGERHARGCTAAIQRVVEHVAVPVIAKETGAGLSLATALRLKELGVAALDVGGVGGTSFAAVEGLRAEAQGAAGSQRLGQVFRDWGRYSRRPWRVIRRSIPGSTSSCTSCGRSCS